LAISADAKTRVKGFKNGVKGSDFRAKGSRNGVKGSDFGV
jgi:hypothetical protein